MPSFFEKELEISGLTGKNDLLYLGAERCAEIIILNKKDMSHVGTIPIINDSIKGGIEIEGLSIFKNFIFIADEKKGRIFTLNLETKTLSRVIVKGTDLSKFTNGFGMEGIAVEESTKLLYLLREKNENHQSEIHTFRISEEENSIHLNHKTQTLIQHENKHWRYSGLAIDSAQKRLLCLKQYYIKDDNLTKLNKREIEYVSLDSLKKNKTIPSPLLSLSKEIYEQRKSFASNIEGIYFDNKSIFITSDNGGGKTRDCNEITTKTVMIKIETN